MTYTTGMNHDHPNKGIAKLEQRRDKGRQRGEATRPNERRALERDSSRTDCKLDTSARRREIEKAMESERSPIR